MQVLPKNVEHFALRQKSSIMCKLDSMNNEYLGTVEFKCDYFSVDKRKLDEQR